MKKVIIAGRGESCDLIIQNATVSRKHAKLSMGSDSKFYVEDLASTNGTFVNGVRITKTAWVTSTDDVRFGSEKLDWQNVKQLLQGESLYFQDNKINSRKADWLPVATIAALLILGLFYWFTGNENSQYRESGQVETAEVKEIPDSLVTATSTGEAKAKDTTPVFQTKLPKIEYSISCLRSKSSLNELIGLGADIEDGWISFSSDEERVEEEIKVGNELKEEVEEEYTAINDKAYHQRVQQIGNRLLSVLDNPRMEYIFHIIKSDDINAFTAGGRIFVTSAIINFVVSDDELACVLSHEIYHNELGHINKLIRKEQSAQNVLGEFADWGLIASSIAGASFNQENEVYCDMYGVDLAIAAGYNGNAAVDLWERMESGNNEVEKIFGTHPFSEERMDCIENHIERNYDVTKNAP